MRLWFIRGLADSDGNVHMNDKSVGITTSPNTKFVNALLRSVGGKTRIEVTPRFGRVVITVQQAADMQIFNPRVLSYRRKTLEKLALAKTFQRHWPPWLQRKVTRLLSNGTAAKEIRDKILDDGVYVRFATLQKKRARYRFYRYEADGCRGRDLSPRSPADF